MMLDTATTLNEMMTKQLNDLRNTLDYTRMFRAITHLPTNMPDGPDRLKEVVSATIDSVLDSPHNAHINVVRFSVRQQFPEIHDRFINKIAEEISDALNLSLMKIVAPGYVITKDILSTEMEFISQYATKTDLQQLLDEDLKAKGFDDATVSAYSGRLTEWLRYVLECANTGQAPDLSEELDLALAGEPLLKDYFVTALASEVRKAMHSRRQGALQDFGSSLVKPVRQPQPEPGANTVSESFTFTNVEANRLREMLYNLQLDSNETLKVTRTDEGLVIQFLLK